MNNRPLFRFQGALSNATVIAIVCLSIVLIADQFLPVQRGLLATYYPNIQWSGPPAFSLIDPVINLDTVYKRRLVFSNKMYSIHWKGWMLIEQPGNYLFATSSDDGSNLFIDGELLIDNGGFHAIREVSAQIYLESGFHHIDIGYFQGEARDDMAVYWQAPGQKRTILPSRILFPEKPKTGMLLLERVIPWGVLVFSFLTLVLLGLNAAIQRKRLYRDLKRIIQKILERVKTLTAGLWRFLISRKRLRRGAAIALVVLIIVFLWLYQAQTEYGLLGMYYDNRAWNDPPVFSAPDSDLTPQSLYQAVDRPQEPNSLRWVGWLHVRTAADYRVSVKTEGAVSLKIHDVVVMKKVNNDRIQTGFTDVYLPEGVHHIDVRYRPGTGTAHILKLRWGTEKTSMSAIPGSLLFHKQPNERQLSLRTVTSWAYWGVLLLGILILTVISISALLHQKPVFHWLTQRSVFRKIVKRTAPNASLRTFFQQTWAHLLIILLLGMLLVFYNLGSGSIITTDFDEGIHTRVAQYMAKTGIWWSLSSSEGVPYYNKPPLKIWLSALTIRLFGDSEFFLRIWDAVFGIFTFLLVYVFGRVLFSNKMVGFLAVLILMGGRDFLLNHNIRTGVMDSLMVFFAVSSLLCFSLRENRPYFYYLSGFCMGLGALTKSVQALVPLVIIVLFLLITRQHVELKTRPFWGMVFLALLLPALWYIPQMIFSPGFFDVAIVQQIFHRVQGKIHRPHVHGPFYFFQVIYHGFFPWSLLALPAIGLGFWQAIRRKNREVIFLLTWILTVFFGFSLSKMKVAWYMNPLYPALSLLIATVCYTTITRLKNEARAYPLLAPLASGIVLVLLSTALYANYQRIDERPEKLPIHVFSEYLQEQGDDPYYLVLYNIQLQDLDYADSYYLDRIPDDRILRTDDIRVIEHLSHQKVSFFVLLKRSDYDTYPLFQEHLYHYWLAPIYANTLYPQKVILVYHHIPENEDLFNMNRT